MELYPAIFYALLEAEGDMNMGIIARWEWRTFGEGSFGKCEEKMRSFGLDSNKKTEELYILSNKSNENVKIRFDVIDVKSLQNVNEDKLEQWLPVLKTGFPISSDSLKELFVIFKVPAPEFKRAEYTYEEFLEELIKPCSELKIVEVKKNRDIFKIEKSSVDNNKLVLTINRQPIGEWFKEQWEKLRQGLRQSAEEPRKSRGFKL